MIRNLRTIFLAQIPKINCLTFVFNVNMTELELKEMTFLFVDVIDV